MSNEVAQLLAASVVASTAKHAEQSLKSLEQNQGFSLTLLHIVANSQEQISTRLAAALFFKNFIKRKWVDEDGNYKIASGDVALVKQEIVPLMITLPNNLQVQIGEAISVIADSDFPDRWPTLLDDLISKLSAEDVVTNKGVLTVAHSIFKRWRPLFRSDELFLEIKFVLDKFAVPFLNMLQTVDSQIDANLGNKQALIVLFEVLHVLIKLYYDLNCQDIPEFFEDNLKQGMSIVHKYLSFSSPLLEDANEEEEVDAVTKVKSSIQELVQLYATRYEDVFGVMIQEFIGTTWNLLTETGTQPKYDILVSKSLAFMTSVVRSPAHFQMFNSEDALKVITEKIIVPNLTLRESDEELFEDDPIEYIRRDLEGSDSDTRRRATTDFLKELKDKNEAMVTQVEMSYVTEYFNMYHQSNNWKYKDLAVYLFSALAITGQVTQNGVSTTNSLLNVVDFFTQQIAPDLSSNHPILKVDAIKYIYTFRNQLNKSQLIEILPVLAQFLTRQDEYVTYTYAAITIERILSIKADNHLVFTKVDLNTSANTLLNNLFQLVFKQTTPEKLSENEFLMKTIYRVLATSEDTISGNAAQYLQQLISVVDVISANPSNPRFSHYCFESIATIIKFNKVDFGAITELSLRILSNDVQEFIPYVFQILSFMLETSNTMTEHIKQLAQPLLAPSVWEYKGNIPGVTRLLKIMIKLDPSCFEPVTALLGVFQKLISSKVNDHFGLELLEYIMLYIPLNEQLQKQITVLLLQRLQNSRTDKYVKKFIRFLSVLAIQRSPEVVISMIDSVQPGLFQQILNGFIITTLPQIAHTLDKKLSVIGMFKVVTCPQFQAQYGALVVNCLEVIIKCAASSSSLANDELPEMDEDTTFGSSFSKLGSISDKPWDPVPQQSLQKFMVEQDWSGIYGQLTPETQKLLGSLQ